MKKVSRRNFLGVAIGTGLAGTATLAGMPLLPKEVVNYLKLSEKNSTDVNLPQPKENGSNLYDVVPPYLHWRFGNEYRGNIHSAKSADFDFWLTPVIERKKYDFRTEVLNKCREIDQKRNGKPIALCYSGGEHSEIIAVALKELGIPFDLYFLNVWYSDVTLVSKVKPFAKRIGVPLRHIGISKKDFIDALTFNTIEYGSDNPNFSLMAYLFDAIPDTHFIVTGSGHLERSGPRFQRIGEKIKIPDGAESYYRPVSTFHVLFYTWAQKNNRVGEFYFYQSSPELLAAVFEDPAVYNNYPFYGHNHLIYSAFPEVSPRSKTTNWEEKGGAALATFARKKIKSYCESHGLDYWHHNIGCAANLAAIYRV